MQSFKTVIIGCGQIAGGYDASAPADFIRTHVRAYHSCPETKLVAVMDIDAERARTFAAHWDVPKHYSSLGEVLEKERPEIVSICSSDGSHAADLRRCLDHSCVRAIWCEKPLALDPSEADEVVKMAAKKDVILAVNHQRQWEPCHLDVAKEIHAGEWGGILGVHATYAKGILHNGSHLISQLRGLLGEPEELRVHRAFCEYSPLDPTVDATLLFSGVPVRVVGLSVTPYAVFESTFYCEQGTIAFADSGRKIIRQKRSPSPAGTLLPPEETATQLDRALYFVLEDICQALQGKHEVRVDGGEALKTLKICLQLAGEGLKLLP